MQTFEYRPNKSYSTYLISVGLLLSFLVIFNVISFRENTFALTIFVFVSVFGWIVYNSIFHTKKKFFLVFDETSLELPAKVTMSGKKETIMYRDLKSAQLFVGDIRNQKRPGHTGLELIFERVEHVEEVCFLQKNHFEDDEYQQIISLISKQVEEKNNASI